MRRATGLFLLAFGLCSVRAFGQAVATWTDTSGNWSNASNWSACAPAACPVVPKNGGGNFYNAVINGTGSDTITFDASGTRVNSLTIGTGETFQDNGLAPTLTIGDPAFPTAGSLTNSGTVNWGNGANLTLDIATGNGSITNAGVINLSSSILTINDGGNGNAATLTGAGVLNLTGALITGSSGDETFVNNSTIQGSGIVGNLSFVNNGALVANGSAPLYVEELQNNGGINVTGAGGLIVGEFANSGGGAAISVTGSKALFGSSVSTSGPITIDHSVLGVNGDLAIAVSQLTLQNDSVGTVSGTLGSGFHSGVVVDNSALLVGGAYTSFASASSYFIAQNGATVLVRGDWTSGEGNIVTINGGSSLTVGGDFGIGDADATVDHSSLFVGGDYQANELTSLTVQNGSSLIVKGDVALGSFSAIAVNGGSTAVIGGSVTNFGIAGLDLSASNVKILGSLTNTNGNEDGTGGNSVFLQDGSTLTVRGTFTNASNAFQNSGGNVLELLGAGNAATIGAVQNSGLVRVDSGSVLTVAGGGFTNYTGGSLNLAGTAAITGGFMNEGGTVTVSPAATLVSDSYSQATGSTDVSGALLSRSYVQNGGSTTIENGGVLTATTFSATGGTVTVNGTLDPAAVEFGPGAALQGMGTIIGNVATGGTITPGSAGGPGTFTILGNYEQLDGSIFDEFISQSSHGVLGVTGDVALDADSLLLITLLGGYDPLGQTFSLMDYGSLDGEFLNGSSFWDDGYLWDVSYGSNAIDVTAVSAPEPGSFLLVAIGLLALGALCVIRKYRVLQKPRSAT